MEPALWVGPAIVAAVISSVVTVASWFVTHTRDRRSERSRRQERIRDLQTALLADIRSYRHRYSSVNLDEYLAAVTDQIANAPDDRPFTPFVPREAASLIWASTVREVHILPTEVIDPVVLFFSHLETVSAFIEDLRSDRFAALEKARKIAMYRDHIRLSRYGLQLAAEAERALREALGLRSLNSSGRDPLVPKSASVPEAVAEGEDRKSA